MRPDDGELYRKHADDLVALATTLVGPTAAADVVAAAVERTISSRHWQGVTDRYAYWVRAVLNEARSFHRATTRRLGREELAARSNRLSIGQPSAESNDSLVSALSDLSPQQRTAIYLTYWRDLPPAAVAELMNVSEGTVRRHLARARSKLRRTLP